MQYSWEEKWPHSTPLCASSCHSDEMLTHFPISYSVWGMMWLSYSLLHLGWYDNKCNSTAHSTYHICYTELVTAISFITRLVIKTSRTSSSSISELQTSKHHNSVITTIKAVLSTVNTKTAKLEHISEITYKALYTWQSHVKEAKWVSAAW